MSRRAAKRQGDRARRALMRAHDTIHGHEYELRLLRRANESLSRRASVELANARSREQNMTEQIQQLRRYLNDVERIVGRYSMAAGAPKVMQRHVYPGEDELRLPFHEPLSFSEFNNRPLDETIARSRYVVMKRLNVRTIQEPIRQAMQLRAGLDRHEVAYYLNDEAIEDTPLEVLIPRIAEEMAEKLILDIRANKANRPFGRFDNYGDRRRFQ